MARGRKRGRGNQEKRSSNEDSGVSTEKVRKITNFPNSQWYFINEYRKSAEPGVVTTSTKSNSPQQSSSSTETKVAPSENKNHPERVITPVASTSGTSNFFRATPSQKQIDFIDISSDSEDVDVADLYALDLLQLSDSEESLIIPETLEKDKQVDTTKGRVTEKSQLTQQKYSQGIGSNKRGFKGLNSSLESKSASGYKVEATPAQNQNVLGGLENKATDIKSDISAIEKIINANSANLENSFGGLSIEAREIENEIGNLIISSQFTESDFIAIEEILKADSAQCKNSVVGLSNEPNGIKSDIGNLKTSAIQPQNCPGGTYNLPNVKNRDGELTGVGKATVSSQSMQQHDQGIGSSSIEEMNIGSILRYLQGSPSENFNSSKGLQKEAASITSSSDFKMEFNNMNGSSFQQIAPPLSTNLTGVTNNPQPMNVQQNNVDSAFKMQTSTKSNVDNMFANYILQQGPQAFNTNSFIVNNERVGQNIQGLQQQATSFGNYNKPLGAEEIIGNIQSTPLYYPQNTQLNNLGAQSGMGYGNLNDFGQHFSTNNFGTQSGMGYGNFNALGQQFPPGPLIPNISGGFERGSSYNYNNLQNVPGLAGLVGANIQSGYLQNQELTTMNPNTLTQSVAAPGIQGPQQQDAQYFNPIPTNTGLQSTKFEQNIPSVNLNRSFTNLETNLKELRRQMDQMKKRFLMMHAEFEKQKSVTKSIVMKLVDQKDVLIQQEPMSDNTGESSQHCEAEPPTSWAELVYCEGAKSIGNKFFCIQPDVRVDSIKSRKLNKIADAYHIGPFRNPDRSQETKLIRMKIDNGIILHYVDGQLSVSNHSQCELFVLTNYSFKDGKWIINDTKQQISIRQGQTTQVYNEPTDKDDYFRKLLLERKSSEEKIQSIKRIYISFDTEWFTADGMLKAHLPCWITIKMKKPEIDTDPSKQQLSTFKRKHIEPHSSFVDNNNNIATWKI